MTAVKRSFFSLLYIVIATGSENGLRRGVTRLLQSVLYWDTATHGRTNSNTL